MSALPKQKITEAEYLAIEGWHDATAAFDIKLKSPNNISTAVISPGANSGNISTTDGMTYLENDQQSTPKAKLKLLQQRGLLFDFS